MKSAIFILLSVLAPGLLVNASVTKSTLFASDIKPNFYNISTISSSEEAKLRDWIKWKNQMPRFGFYLNYVSYKCNIRYQIDVFALKIEIIRKV